MSKVYLFVEINIKPGLRSAFAKHVTKQGAHIRTEDGCETLEILFDTNNENQICVWEVWTNRELWDAHMANDASKAWQKIAAEFVDGEKITVMDLL